MKHGVAVFFALMSSACCASLPRLPDKRVAALAPVASEGAVTESQAVWRDEERSRDIPVRIYAPANATRPRPLVVFSHGIGEDRDSYAYIGRALAMNGFIAVHITHAGTDKEKLRQGYWKLYQATKDPENWRNRPRDVTFVIDRMLQRADVDANRIAVAGHSAGAFTAFALAGARDPDGESFLDRRVRAIVPMSMPRIPGLSYAEVRVPALNITGTCDSSIIYRTKQRDRRVPFEQTTAVHQYLVTLDRVNHNAFSNADDPHHPAIVALTIAFLRAWLLDDEAARAWFDDPGRGSAGTDKLTLEAK